MNIFRLHLDPLPTVGPPILPIFRLEPTIPLPPAYMHNGGGVRVRPPPQAGEKMYRVGGEKREHERKWEKSGKN